MKYILPFLIINLLSVPFYAQIEITFPTKKKEDLDTYRSDKSIDLTGLWEGQISQLNWDGQPEFTGVTGKLHVEIKQTGNRIKGLFVCRAKFAKNKGYLSYEKKFRGNWNGKTLEYLDEEVDNYINTHKSLRHLETCLKQASLNFYKTKGAFHLEGEWSGQGHITGVDCIPGKIHLTKVNPEDLALEVALTSNANFEQNDGMPVELKWDDDNKLKKIKDRKVEKGKTIVVRSRTINITVYDHKQSDGDIISLNYNGNWLLERYKINNQEHSIDVLIDDNGKQLDYLLLYAHNLGKFPPNTVAVIVNDGYTKQRFILNSDMHVCDAIYFKLNKPKH